LATPLYRIWRVTDSLPH